MGNNLNGKLTKNDIMQLIASGRGIETFEHVELGFFDVTAMRARALTHGTRITVDIHCVADFVSNNRVYDRERMRSLTPEQINDPILYVHLPNEPQGDCHLLIDGSHRAIRRAHEGFTTVDAYVLEERDIIRPDFSKGFHGPDVGLDWGDDISSLAYPR